MTRTTTPVSLYTTSFASLATDLTVPATPQLAPRVNCGVAGTVNAAIGAPSLVDDEWLYGDSDEALQRSIAIGRSGEMPAFGERLDETQIRLLVALLTRDSPPQ